MPLIDRSSEATLLGFPEGPAAGLPERWLCTCDGDPPSLLLLQLCAVMVGVVASLAGSSCFCSRSAMWL